MRGPTQGSPPSAGSGGIPTIVNAGNLGAAYTLDLAGGKDVWLTGTLNANTTITVAGLSTGAKFRLLLTQDATGGRTVAVSDGSSSAAPAVDTAPSAASVIEALSPNGTDIDIVGAAPAAGPNGVTAARPAVLLGGMPTVNPSQADYLAMDAQLAPAKLDTLMLFNGWAAAMLFGGNQNVADALGAQLMIAWQPSPNVQGTANDGTLGNVATGVLDAYLTTSANAAKAWGKPITLRLAHEFNGNWTSYGNTKETAAAFISGWQYVVNFFRAAGVTNVQWCWSPSAWGRHASGPIIDPTPFYPGDDYVDVIGLDGYQNLLNPSPVDWPEDVFRASYNAMTRLSQRPITIAEVGVAEDARFSKATWWDRFFTMVKSMPRLVGVNVWARSDRAGTEGDYSLDSSGTDAAALAAFAHGVNASPFQTPNDQLVNGVIPKTKASKQLRPQASQSRLWLPDGATATSWLGGTAFKVKDANFSLHELVGNDIRLVDGQSLLCVGPILREGEPYTKAAIHTGSQASVAPTHTIFALFDQAGNLIAGPIDYTSAIGATGLFGGWTFPTIRRPIDTPTYAFLMQKGGTAWLDLRGKLGVGTAFAASPRATGYGPSGLSDVASVQAALVNGALPAALTAPATTNLLPWIGVG